MPNYRLFLMFLLLSLCPAAGVSAADADTQPKPGSESTPPKPAFNAKSTFRNICGFCHENYGRKAGKGPQLMNSETSDKILFDRIKNGKPGRMAAFGGNFTDDQIHELVAFIRSLNPNVDP